MFVSLSRIAVLCLALVFGASARSVEFGKLVMPGPLIEGHAELEGECTSCHQPFDRKQQRMLCLACHEGVASDIDLDAGFHGKHPRIEASRCRDCHTDHEGRAADIVVLDQETFDHRATDFALHGKHRGVDCSACHKAEKKHRDAPGRCVDCHREDDPHTARLGEDCASCHVDRGWLETKFDHGKTDFPLAGRHEDVACGLCHAGERYEGTPQDCRSCHATNDVHRGEFGRDCARCHTPDRWDRSHFDHGRETEFSLRDRHAKIDCRACHTGPLERQNLDPSCASCHTSDDVHRGRNGRDCASCHDTRRWRDVSFDHDRETDFPLEGGHEELRCQSCHRSDPRKVKLETGCVSCHRPDDAHAGTQGQDCGRCHNPTGWSSNVFFDHDLTRFPLLGMHASAPCEACHSSTDFHDTETACVACHKEDDAHTAKLGRDCGRCHNPNSWSRWRFDHDTATDFPLRGSHEGLNCLSCHTRAMKGPLRQSSDCASCHAFDDAHDGGFGRDCGRCHNDVRWTEISLDQIR